MPEKRRFTISLPEHIADELARRATPLSSNPTEYAADIIRWWYGQGSPALNDEERRVQAELTDKPSRPEGAETDRGGAQSDLHPAAKAQHRPTARPSAISKKPPIPRTG